MTVRINRQFFRNYMRKHHVSAAQLAKHAGLTKATLSRFLHGVYSNASTDTLNKLISALDLDEDSVGCVFIFPNKLRKQNVMEG